MGCDGGTIPKRSELVKTAKRPEQKDKDMDRSAKWTTCTISQQSLTAPIMSCELGKLYSKESVLEYLLDHTISAAASHIQHSKDVKELKLTPNVGFVKKPSGLADQYFDTQAAKYVCPIIGLEMNGKYKFCFLWTCGCVISERALKEIDTDTCHNCATKFEKDDVIVLNPDGDDLRLMETRMDERREKIKALRKLKKEKSKNKRKLEDEKTSNQNGFKVPAALPNSNLPNGKEVVVSKKTKKTKTKIESSSSGSNSKLSSKKASTTVKNGESSIDHTKSEVFKSLFTSSEGAGSGRDDKKAHWVTYNPYHL